MLTSVRQALAQPGGVVQEVTVGGVTYRKVTPTGGASHLVLGRVNPAGRVETYCVSSEEEARRFLDGEVRVEQ